LQELTHAVWGIGNPTCAGKSRYSLIGEFAGLIKEQNHVDICHHLLTIDPEIALMPSASFCCRLAQLLGCTAAGQKNQSTQNNRQNHLTYKNRNAFHHFPFSSAGTFIVRTARNTTHSKLIIPAATGLVNGFRSQIVLYEVE